MRYTTECSHLKAEVCTTQLHGAPVRPRYVYHIDMDPLGMWALKPSDMQQEQCTLASASFRSVYTKLHEDGMTVCSKILRSMLHIPFWERSSKSNVMIHFVCQVTEFGVSAMHLHSPGILGSLLGIRGAAPYPVLSLQACKDMSRP